MLDWWEKNFATTSELGDWQRQAGTPSQTVLKFVAIGALHQGQVFYKSVRNKNTLPQVTMRYPHLSLQS